MATDLPKHLLKITIALLKSPARNFLGEEFMDAVGDALLEVGGEEAQQKIDEFLLTLEGTKQLQGVARRADAYFQQHCEDAALLGAFSFSFGNLEDIQQTLQTLPKALDAGAIDKTLAEALERDLGDKLTSQQRLDGARLYRLSLFHALAPLKKYTQTVIAQTVLENNIKLDALGETLKKGLMELRALLEALTQRELPFQAESEETTPGFLPRGSFLQNFERNPIFTGRENFLEKLANALTGANGEDVVVTQALAGMGGVGKTQLAIEFAYRHGHQFKGVHWLNATEAHDFSELFPALATCGAAMNLPEWPAENIPAQAQTTLNAWNASGPRLIILDNLEDLAAADAILPHLQGKTMRLLVTSRYSDWPKTMPVQAIPLEEFTPEESFEFLRKYLDEVRASQEQVIVLAERLGYLPLALELAGRYLERRRNKSIPAYLEELNLKHASLNDWRAGDLPNPTRHEMNVARTFAISWNAIVDETARTLFKLGGYFAPNLPLPYQTLFWAAGLEDTDAFEESLLTLKAFALLKDDDSLHPLLAEFARLQDPDDSLLSAWAEALARQCYPGTRGGGIWHSPLLAQHARYALTDLQRASAANREASSLAFYTAFLCRHFGDLDGAMQLYKESLEIKEGLGDLQGKSATLHAMAYIYRTRGDLDGAMQLYKDALEIDEGLGDLKGKSATLAMLAQLHIQNANYREALTALLTSLQTLEKIGAKPDAQQVAGILTGFRKNVGAEVFDPVWKEVTNNAPLPDWLLSSGGGDASAAGMVQQLTTGQFIGMCITAAREKRPEAAQLFEAAGKIAGDPKAPPEYQALGKTLQKIMAGAKNPDLSGLPDELAELVRKALEDS